MNIFKQFKRDNDRIVSGAPLEIEKGVYIKIARMHESNPAFKDAAQKALEVNQTRLDAIKDATKRTEEAGKLSEDAFAATCIKGWVGLTNEDGTPLEYNDANIARIRTELPELWESMVRFALNSANYLGSFDEDASLKNSQTASDLA